jgi:hypothetical protein
MSIIPPDVMLRLIGSHIRGKLDVQISDSIPQGGLPVIVNEDKQLIEVRASTFHASISPAEVSLTLYGYEEDGPIVPMAEHSTFLKNGVQHSLAVVSTSGFWVEFYCK